MSFWDEIKNFTKPYSDDEDYDDYDDEMEDSFEEEAPQPERTPRFGRREAAPAQEPAYAPAVNNTTAFTPASTGFNGQVVGSSNKVQLILVRRLPVRLRLRPGRLRQEDLPGHLPVLPLQHGSAGRPEEPAGRG